MSDKVACIVISLANGIEERSEPLLFSQFDIVMSRSAVIDLL